MGVKVKATLGTEKYYTEVIAGENTLITDEPVDKGGGNKGFNPFEILATSLASCTAATLRVYIDRKGWDIPTINVEVDLENFPQTRTAQFCRIIDFGATEVSEEIKDRLFKIADACPVHKILTNNIEILTKI
ncbi:OsmC family protein [Epilithonimonas ginsengisoli]|uniref:OsmC family protein n=1 Tax=Epilithonimonas ginsengisoli TaxID=1245592 RepID=A0ABU4JLL3_9FLAO|nr:MULTISPECIES: OsmC family protein [Chryseobacterium group]MBV6881430.1 OsmC family protein [Epilithonimonas sp. FP105]MDW8550428.1 OsmC family protein [Epilithonimonas ginsengisoli]OAH73263.1 osmotically inducible protein OsmC [Chryseobacterium sp. FP211-J200]